LLHRLRRTVAVIDADQRDLAPVDPAALIEPREVGGLHPPKLAIGRGRAAVWYGLSDLYFGVADARRLVLLFGCTTNRRQCGN
jgi:hypothetical protein